MVLRKKRCYQYQLHFQFLPKQEYQHNFAIRPKHILKKMSESYFKLLFTAISKTANSKVPIVEIDDKEKTKAKANEDNDDADLDERNNNAEKQQEQTMADDDSSDNDKSEDGDATRIKLKARRGDNNEYDDPDDVEEIDDANGDTDSVISAGIVNGTQNNDNNEMDAMTENVMRNESVVNFEFDKQHHLWCKLTFNLEMCYRNFDMSTILRELAGKFVLHQVDHIKRAIMCTDEKDRLFIKTDGINLVEMFKHNEILDLNSLYSNDIQTIARTYGIEAAARVIVKEITNVFRVYGITIDQRHLSLIADYMTFDGTFKPLSRKGMEHGASPLQQMSFESSLQFLKLALERGHTDQLNSPSARLMVGLPIRNGTGAFELLTKLS